MVLNPTLSQLAELYARFPRVSIVGVGDEGNDIISQIFEHGGSGAQCISVSTNATNLEHIYSHEKVLIKGQAVYDAGGSGGHEAEQETIQRSANLITPLLIGTDVTFIIVGSADAGELNVAAATASVARQIGAVTVGMATLPADSQDTERLISPHGLALMRHSCHTMAIVDAKRSAQFSEYRRGPRSGSADQLAIDVVSGLSQALACPSAVNIELPAFRELMMHGGIAHVGIAHSTSALRIEEATMGALRGPLLYDTVARCRGALLNVRGDASLTIEEAERAAELVAERAGWEVPVVMGTVVDESQYEGCQVSILLTGGVYPYIPGGYRRLPLDMYEMEPSGEEEGPLDLKLDLDQLEEA
jgi:cell division protein FtsZ